jgi:hypothetical protein
VANLRTRPISPFSDLTVADWVQNRIQEGTLDDLRAAKAFKEFGCHRSGPRPIGCFDLILAYWLRILQGRSETLGYPGCRLGLDALRWDRSSRDESYLLRGAGRVQFAMQVQDQHADELNETVRAFLDESFNRFRSEEVARHRLSLYEQVRTATLQKYVRPFLEKQMDEIKVKIQQEAEERENRRFIRFTETEAIADQGISEIRNLLDPNGKWHLEPAQLFRELGADMDYTSVCEFPCCGRTVLASTEPSQFRADGCESSPILRT